VGKVGKPVEGYAVTSPLRLGTLERAGEAFPVENRRPVMGPAALCGRFDAAIVGSVRTTRGTPRAPAPGVHPSQAGAATRAEATEEHHEAHVNARLQRRGQGSARPTRPRA
jgi:hypothetical protein